MPRGWQSYRDRRTKAELLRIAWVLPAAKAIPRPGSPAKRDEAASQLYLGFMLGQDRSTTNRDLRKFCGEDATVARFFNKKRPGIGCVNRYSHFFPDLEYDKRKVLKTLDPDKLAGKFGQDLFDAAVEGCSGAGDVALWTYDGNVPRTRRCGCKLGQMKFYADRNCLKCGGKGYTVDGDKMGPNARIVLTVLQLKGIAKWGFLELTCEKIAELTGLCVNTVAAALDEWENLKVLQIVPGKVIYEDFADPKTGKPAVKCRYPQRIIWLPGQLLDHDVAERERHRFAQAAEIASLNAITPEKIRDLAVARRRHAELLSMFLLSRHSVGSLWSYLRAWLIRRENCDKDLVDSLFPLHKAWNDS